MVLAMAGLKFDGVEVTYIRGILFQHLLFLLGLVVQKLTSVTGPLWVYDHLQLQFTYQHIITMCFISCLASAVCHEGASVRCKAGAVGGASLLAGWVVVIGLE